MNRAQRRAAQRTGRKTRTLPVPSKCCLLQVTPTERHIQHTADCPATTSPNTLAGKVANLEGIQAVDRYARRMGWTATNEIPDRTKGGTP